MSADLRRVLDAIKMQGGFGKASASTLNVMRGINHRGPGNLAPANLDNQGYTFFTKPNLNLSYDNVMAARRLSFLANDDPASMATAIRCVLSPQVNPQPYNNWSLSSHPIERRLPRSTIVDDKMAFMPIFNNTMLSLSGWPDFVLDLFESPEGLRKEVVSWVDSSADMNGAFELSGTFQNVDGSPLMVLLAAWAEYMGRVATGELAPYPQCIAEHEIDYMTRIYRVILDPTKTYVRKIACTVYSIMSAVPIGADFNYNADSSMFSLENSQINVRFSSVGVLYNDPIVVYAFNRTTETFNPSLSDKRRADEMVKIEADHRLLFNYRAYPRISDTNELEWFVSKEEYNETINTLTTTASPSVIAELYAGRGISNV